jgi:hypothetical protein
MSSNRSRQTFSVTRRSGRRSVASSSSWTRTTSTSS